MSSGEPGGCAKPLYSSGCAVFVDVHVAVFGLAPNSQTQPPPPGSIDKRNGQQLGDDQNYLSSALLMNLIVVMDPGLPLAVGLGLLSLVVDSHFTGKGASLFHDGLRTFRWSDNRGLVNRCSWRDVFVRHIENVDQDAFVVPLVGSWKFGTGKCSSSIFSDLNLCAVRVTLRTRDLSDIIVVESIVQSNELVSNNISAGLDVARDGDRVDIAILHQLIRNPCSAFGIVG
jgi:hypothetical protein